VALVPEGRFSHTCDMVEFEALRGTRCLIPSGRQSAFEWAALLHEAGTAEHLLHRHSSPAFAAADWSWVSPIVDSIAENAGWFRQLLEQEQAAVGQRLWAEGRLKLEPWLAARGRTRILARSSGLRSGRAPRPSSSEPPLWQRLPPPKADTLSESHTAHHRN
jgi:hypothetical protein